MEQLMRVFVSSTFVGLEKERAYLMTKVFPVLKMEALKRSVSLFPLDLRWGVTKEQAEQGKIVWICLNEINKSKPFFIGILGKRYGWQPKLDILQKDTQLEVSFPLIRSDLRNRRSMTEIEIQHAVLRNKERMDAFFYVTDNTDIEEPQKRLIEEIQNDGRYQIHYFHNPEDLGQQIQADLSKLLKERFPIRETNEYERLLNYQLSELSQLTDKHIERGYIESQIDTFIQNDDSNKLLIYGPKGCGKSNIIAKWISTREDKIVYVFVGGSLIDKDYTTIQHYLLDRLYYLNGLTNDKDEYKGNAFNRLVSLFDTLSSKTKQNIIVIDGLDQVIEADDELHSLLAWLPNPPQNIKLIVCSNSAKHEAILHRRSFKIISVPSLIEEERTGIINLYLQKFSKTLSDEQVDLLASDSKSEDAVVLTSMLNEMVSDSVFETVDTYINQYIQAHDKMEFFTGIINRASEKFGKKMVEEILGLILLSKAGLKIDEITEILKISILDWSQFYCAYSFLFVEHNGLITVKDDDVRRIIQNEVINAALKECLYESAVNYFNNILSEKKLNDIHILSEKEIMSILKCEFYSKDITDEDKKLYIRSYLFSDYLFNGKERALEELAHLYWSDNKVDLLFEHLLYPVCVVYMQRTHFESLKQYWKYITKIDNLKSIKAYSLLENEEQYTYVFISEYYYSIAILANSDPSLVNSDYVIQFLGRSIAFMEMVDFPSKESFLIPRYNTMASLYYDRKDPIHASIYYEKARRALGNNCDEYSKKNQIILSINKAQNYYDLGQYEDSLKTCESVILDINESQFTSTEKNELLASVFNIKGNALANKKAVHSNINYLQQSVEVLKQSIKLYVILMEVDAIHYSIHYAKTLSNLACSYKELGQYQDANKTYNEAETILKNCNPEDLKSLEILAKIQVDFGAMLIEIAETHNIPKLYEYAKKKLQDSQISYQTLHNHDSIKYSISFADAFYYFGRLARRIKRPDKAVQAYTNALKLYGTHEEQAAQCFAELGLTYFEMGKLIEMRETLTSALHKFENLYSRTNNIFYRDKIVQIKDLLNSKN
jgi:hypothetical protein